MKKFLMVVGLIIASVVIAFGGFLLGSYIGNVRKTYAQAQTPKPPVSSVTATAPVNEPVEKPKDTGPLPFGQTEDRRISGITLGMEYDEVVKILGKPQYEKKPVTDVFGTHKEVNYSLGKLKFDENKGKYLLKSIVVTKYGLNGPRDIKLGDTVETVLKKFPDKNQPPKGMQRWLYGDERTPNGVVSYDKKAKIIELNYNSEPGRTDTSGLRLKIKYNKVTEMELWLDSI